MTENLQPYGILKNDEITYLLPNTINKIGRNPVTNTIILNHHSISKEHAMIEFNSNRQGYISDLFSSNGTFVNGKKISSNQKTLLNDGDFIKFGNDPMTFKYTTNKLSNINIELNNTVNNNQKLINSVNQTQLMRSSDFINVNQNNLLQSQLILNKNKLDTASFNYNELYNAYNILKAKHDALVNYANNLQKKNDLLELEIKNNKRYINTLESKELSKLILDKEKIIKILQSENNFYSTELHRIKECFNKPDIRTQLDLLINEYLLEMENFKKANDIFREQNIYTDRKWTELLQSNKLLKSEIDLITQKWNEDTMKFESIIKENDSRLNNALSQIPMCYNDFNVNKENAAKFLVQQVNLYLNEKNALFNEIKDLKKQIVELCTENEKLKDEICQISSKMDDLNVKNLVDKTRQLEDCIVELKQIVDINKNINYERIILGLNKELTDNKNMVNELRQKIKINMGDDKMLN